MPDHACPYDLLPRSPWIVAAIALHFLGCFSVGWANFVYWLGHHRETADYVPTALRRWLRVSLFSYLISMAVIGIAVWLA